LVDLVKGLCVALHRLSYVVLRCGLLGLGHHVKGLALGLQGWQLGHRSPQLIGLVVDMLLHGERVGRVAGCAILDHWILLEFDYIILLV
jgi:hypothetical protein